jgi:hypothetical protein
MKCSHARAQFSSYLDRDLSFQEEADLRQHLEDCPGCAEEMTRLERVQGLLRGLPQTDPGPGFYQSVRARIDAVGVDAEVDPIRQPFSPGDLLRRLLAPMWLRPAAGLAFGLALGLLIGTGADLQGPARIGGGAPAIVQTDPVDPPAISSVDGPLADIPIPPPESGDSVRVVGEEYILDPYVRDSQNGLVPVNGGYRRPVSQDQSDGYITF